jgi:dihydropyrimidinase
VTETQTSRVSYDVVLRGGTVGTSTGTFQADVGIRGGLVVALGLDLDRGATEVDARGKLVLPGGVDTHCHIEQVSAAGLLNADTFESATMSAAAGGTTTVVSFAAQHAGLKLDHVVADYAALAAKGAIVDYAFHMIIADPTEECLTKHLPQAIRAGHPSIKVFMTYDKIRLHDEQILDVMLVAREHGALLCVHAENHGMISWMGKRLVEKGYVAPKFHAPSHPRVSEAEAFERLIRMSQLLDQPVMIFHVSTAEGAAIIRRARGEGIKVFAETCPQYLFLTADDLDKPGLEGAKWMCSPPARTKADQDALWRHLALGDLQTISSDHAPYAFDSTGKLAAGRKPTFKQIANGLPGLQMRLPLLFDAMVSKGRLGVEAFVNLTATAPAAIYGLTSKGEIAIGKDADIVVWDPRKRVTLDDAMVLDRTRYTPYAGRKIAGWPHLVLRRGEVIVKGGKVSAAPGSGQWIRRSGGWAAAATGRVAPEFDPKRNGGAVLY